MNAAAREVAPDRAADLAQLVELTHTLRDRVERAAWGEAAELEGARRALVEKVFDVAPSQAELPALIAALKEVVRLNDELIGLAEHQRRGVARDLDTLALGREASRAYSNVRGPIGVWRP